MDAFKKQVGGNHYKDYEIQPYEFFFRNKIPHHKAAIIRRILRYDHPTGKGIEDLDKIAHEIELIKDLEIVNDPTFCEHRRTKTCSKDGHTISQCIDCGKIVNRS